MTERLRQLERWLRQACGLSGFSVEPASADASFRRYFRVSTDDGATLVAMDAPPDKEDSRPFILIAERLAAAGLHAPRVHVGDPELGFLLLEDLGNRAYLDCRDDGSADELYGDAIAALLRMQRNTGTEDLPSYDRAMLMREMQLFPDWLLSRHLGLTLDDSERAMLDGAFETLIDNALDQPRVFVHRDYHSRNLMLAEQDNPGIIDFQDAVFGPVTYDLVSLLRDCYIAWPRRRLDKWVKGYFDAASKASLIDGVDEKTFRTWFDLMGVQRHLKAAGIFARLYHRDDKPGYLADIPRTLGYIVDVGKTHAATTGLADFVETSVLPDLGSMPK